MVTLDEAIEPMKNGYYEAGMVILQCLREHDMADLDMIYDLGTIYSDMGRLDKEISTLARLRDGRINQRQTVLSLCRQLESVAE